MMKTAFMKSCLGLMGIAASVFALPAEATSLKGRPNQFNTPVGEYFVLSNVRIADGGAGRFAVLWAESTDFDSPVDQNEKTRFRAYSAIGATPLGSSNVLVGPTNVSPVAVGIRSAGAGKYQAIWGDKINGLSSGQPIYERKFNGNTPSAAISILRNDTAAKVANASFTALNDGSGVLITSCNCFPTIYTGQRISKEGKLTNISQKLSQGDSIVTLNFNPIGFSSLLGAYLTDADRLAIRLFGPALTGQGFFRVLPIKTKPADVSSHIQLGTLNNKIFSIYTVDGDIGKMSLYGRYSGPFLDGSNPYKVFLKNVAAVGLAADDLPNGQFLLAYKVPDKQSIFVARFNSNFVRVGSVAEIKGNGLIIRSLKALSNGEAILAYEIASGKGQVQRLTP